MTRPQRFAILVGIGFAVAIGLYPPWQQRTMTLVGREIVASAGHAPLFKPPPTEPVGVTFHTYQVDVARLAIYWVIIALATAAATVALGLGRQD